MRILIPFLDTLSQTTFMNLVTTSRKNKRWLSLSEQEVLKKI